MAERLNEPSQPTSRKNWTDVELICLWSDDIIQEELEGPRNKLVFEKISKSLNNKGYKRTTGQCRDKIKKLTIEKYRTTIMLLGLNVKHASFLRSLMLFLVSNQLPALQYV